MKKSLETIKAKFIQNLQQAFEDKNVKDKFIALIEEYRNERITRDECQNRFFELTVSVIDNMPPGTVPNEIFRMGFIDGLIEHKKNTPV